MMLGGTYLKRPDIVALGKELVETCRRTYEATTTRIGPEYWQWDPAGKISAFTADTEWHQMQRDKTGWWVIDARWMLRPETVESYFYAYRITGEKKYQDWAWDAYTAYVRAAKAKHGYAEVKDVTKEPGADNQSDKAESFWGGE
jgi:mannosyl-oligosaccharide alpha-1,2-mannosidase